jgi:hypothetical protein
VMPLRQFPRMDGEPDELMMKIDLIGKKGESDAKS